MVQCCSYVPVPTPNWCFLCLHNSFWLKVAPVNPAGSPSVCTGHDQVLLGPITSRVTAWAVCPFAVRENCFEETKNMEKFVNHKLVRQEEGTVAHMTLWGSW